MSLPLVDLQADAPEAQARRIDVALRETGFFAVTNHGVPAAVATAAFDAGHRFFALPEDTKQRWHIDRWPLRRGFDPIGWQALDPTQPPDLKESARYGQRVSLQWPP